MYERDMQARGNCLGRWHPWRSEEMVCWCLSVSLVLGVEAETGRVPELPGQPGQLNSEYWV